MENSSPTGLFLKKRVEKKEKLQSHEQAFAILSKNNLSTSLNFGEHELIKNSDAILIFKNFMML